VVRHGEVYADAETAARAWAEQSGGSYLHAYDDPAVIAGQGTIGLEIARHAPWCDLVAVSVGGGGLAAGLSVSLGPDHPVVAVEPEHCNSLHAAFSAGGPADAPVDSAAASALGASRIGQNAFALLSSGKVQLALVTERKSHMPGTCCGKNSGCRRAGRRCAVRRMAVRPGFGPPSLPGPLRREHRLASGVAEVEAGRDLGVRQPCSDEPHHLAFPFAQDACAAADRVPGGRAAAEIFDGAGQLLAGGVLEQEAAGSGRAVRQPGPAGIRTQ
jgi:Pyridoxal-phosphate dependent enzyme